MDQAQTTTNEISILSKEEVEALETDVRFFTTKRGPRLAYHEYGDPNGHPMIFYHGSGSHVHGMMLHKPGQRHGFRIIAPDRPGVAQSDYRPGWTPLDYAEDMADLADSLGFDTFAAVGISGGGPTLYASAYRTPERLRCVVPLACSVPLYRDPAMRAQLGFSDRMYAYLGASLPLRLFALPFSLLGFMQRWMKSPKSFAKMFGASLCKADKELFSHPEVQYIIMRDFQELFRNGSIGPSADAQTNYRDWPFRLADIQCHLELFHGAADKFIPKSFSEWLVKQVPDANLNLIPGQGHFYHVACGYQLLETIKAKFYTI